MRNVWNSLEWEINFRLERISNIRGHGTIIKKYPTVGVVKIPAVMQLFG